MKKKLVILSGAGLSAESGIKTFRDCEDGLWNNFKLEEVCTPNAWAMNPTKVLDFYNERRIEVLNAQPNDAHVYSTLLEKEFDVTHVTQNVDDLLERAGATNIIHLHGEITKARSSCGSLDWMGMSPDEKINNPKLYDVGREGLNYYKNYADDGFPLRPHIVFFGESVPKITDAVDVIKEADVLIVVGTSLNVAPASSLVWNTKDGANVYYIDPFNEDAALSFPCRYIKMSATKGMEEVYDLLIGIDK